MKLFYEYMVIFFNLSTSSSHLYPLQAENCDSNSRLVVDEDDNVKSGTTKKKHVFFLPSVRIRLLPISGKKFISRDTKYFTGYVFLACYFRRPH